jgi:hypothetical protein
MVARAATRTIWLVVAGNAVLAVVVGVWVAIVAARRDGHPAARERASPPVQGADAVNTLAERTDQDDPDDRGWSAQTRSRVAAALVSADLDGNRLLDVACKARVCRIEVAHETIGARDALMENLGEVIGDDVRGDITRLPDRTLIYVARPRALKSLRWR